MNKLFSAAVLFLIISSPIFGQSFQIGVATGPAFPYVVEDASTDMDYFYGMGFQTDFIHLDEDLLPNYGFNFISSSAEMHNSNYYYGIVNNTSVSVSKYFSWRFFDIISSNINIGTGPNFESFQSRQRLMMNIQLGAEIKAELISNWHLQVKGLAVGQDVVNIIRYYSYGDWEIAGEDLHVMLLFGIAVDITK